MAHYCRRCLPPPLLLAADGVRLAVCPSMSESAGVGTEEDAPPVTGASSPPNSIAADASGFIWLATERTLHRLNPRAAGTGGADAEGPTWRLVGTVGVAPLPSCGSSSSRGSGGIEFVAPASRDEARVVLVMTDGRCFTVDFAFADDVDATSAATLTAALDVKEGEEGDLPWEVVCRLPVGNHDHFVCETGGKLWVAGGLTHYRGFPATLHVFDELFSFSWRPAADVDVDEPAGAAAGGGAAAAASPVGEVGGGTWSSLPMPTQRCYNGLAAMDSKIYIVGGAEPQDWPAQSVRLPQASVLVYDVVSEAWLPPDFCPPLPETRMECCAAAVGGRLYVICGVTEENAGPTLTSVLSWSPGEATWTDEPPAPEPMRQFCCAVIGETIYAVGGNPSQFIAFDTSSRSWASASSSADEGQAAAAAAAVLAPHPIGPQAPLVGAHGGELWVIGGARQRAVHVWSPQTNTWRQEPDLPCEQSWGAAWSYQGRLLVVGGAHYDPRPDGTPVFDDRVFGLRREGGGAGGGGL